MESRGMCMCVVVCRKELNWNLTSCFMSIEDSVSVAAKCCQAFCVAYEVWSISYRGDISCPILRTLCYR